MGVVRQIARAFEDEGLVEDPDDTHPWYDAGDRRGTFDRHVSQVDWSDPGQVRQVLGALSTIMTWGDGDYADGERVKLRRLLARDGFTVDDDGAICPNASTALGSIPLESLADPSAILEHLERLAEATDRDPATAISGAKALVEATTKVVLRELGVAYDERATVPVLVKEAQKALKLHPDTLAPTALGVEIVSRLLSNLSQVAIGLAELRNQYGPDHGRSTAVVGFGPRHGHLAVGAATTYCRLLIETLDARRVAPAAVAP
jgi:hypothetical protein